MRIYQPTNEFGQALLNQGQLVVTSKAITKGVSDNGTITLTSSIIPDIADWDVRSVSVVIGGELMSFQPEIKRGGSGSIVITFHGADEKIEGLGDATIVLSLVNSDGFIHVLTIEEKIAEAIASHDAEYIRAVAAEAKATGKNEYRFATCKNDAELSAAGFSKGSYNGENLMCLVSGQGVFSSAPNITSFTGDLPLLEVGNQMFAFGGNGFTSFTGDLSSLTSGWEMFKGRTGMTSFNSDLPKLENGINMFYHCILDQASVDRILASINDLASQGKTGTLTLHVASGVDNHASEFLAKGWTID